MRNENLKLAEILCDGVIFQHSKPIRIFGSACGNVTVCFDGESQSVEANGKWMIEFPPRGIGGPYEMVVTCGEESITVTKIMIGEVILFSGQSNNWVHMFEVTTPFSEYVDDFYLRTFVCERPEDDEIFSPMNGWLPARRYQIPGWAALPYLTGHEARMDKDCPVGVIACSQGASCIQSWIDKAAFTGEDAPLDNHVDTYPLYETWNHAGWLYDHMLSQVIPFSVGCVVWYQGEINARENEVGNYLRMLEMLTACWRKAFNDENLFFCIIQLADFIHAMYPEYWKKIQEAQELAQFRIPNVKTVRCADICENDVIHPPTKDKLAKRIYDAIK